jgi:signal transduction histidine kinase
MSATRLAGGLGIGLYLSKAIVEAHGGRLGMMSEPGRGSRFWFSLPARGAAGREPAGAGRARVEPGALPGGRPRR